MLIQNSWFHRLSIFTGALCLLNLLTFAGHVVGEGSSQVTEERARFLLYQVNLSNVPIDVSADDFHVDLIGTQFIHITIDNSAVDWKIRLHQSIPSDVIFYPEFSVTMLRAEGDTATWTVSVRIPKYYELEPIMFEREEL